MTERGVATDLGLGRHREITVCDDRRLGRRTAHVEDDAIVEPELAAQPLRPDDTCCRTRFDDEDRFLRCNPGRQYAAVRLHDV